MPPLRWLYDVPVLRSSSQTCLALATCGSPLAFSAAHLITHVRSVEHPTLVFFPCHDGYWLDGKWRNASNASSANMRLVSACALDGYSPVLEDPCVRVRRGIGNEHLVGVIIRLLPNLTRDFNISTLDHMEPVILTVRLTSMAQRAWAARTSTTSSLRAGPLRSSEHGFSNPELCD